ncbi:glycoside hydrolase family 16 protein [Trinickia violacea]|uniref:Glycoside hydrolase family 16 protein n=1 Tax=Trinickia violacea TaxID=2571746 RepID=A0A4P8IK27_9BURK|nr:glycoside hydrolase family 16 protein [Trinickia violacea]QCP47905.1 glycoside hydrolase family 16 protein [Trinickia violacea]
MKITQLQDGRFACVELESLRQFGFGRYAFEVRGPIGAIDPNVVLGVFLYPPKDVGPDGTNEIDVELARWGISDGPQVNYTAWYRSHKGNRHSTMRVPSGLDDASFELNWQPEEVDWDSSLQADGKVGFRKDLAEKPQTLVINLWLYKRPRPVSQGKLEFLIKFRGPL